MYVSLYLSHNIWRSSQQCVFILCNTVACDTVKWPPLIPSRPISTHLASIVAESGLGLCTVSQYKSISFHSITPLSFNFYDTDTWYGSLSNKHAHVLLGMMLVDCLAFKLLLWTYLTKKASVPLKHQYHFETINKSILSKKVKGIQPWSGVSPSSAVSCCVKMVQIYNTILICTRSTKLQSFQ